MTDSQRKIYPANGIGHFDIGGPDVGALGRFYAGVFGWSIKERGPGYASVETPSGTVNGALVESDEPAFTVGVVVPSFDAALEAAVALGGAIVLPPTDNGWVTKAQIQDPAGNRVTLRKG